MIPDGYKYTPGGLFGFLNPYKPGTGIKFTTDDLRLQQKGRLAVKSDAEAKRDNVRNKI